MATGQVVTNNGLKTSLNRTFKSTPDYTSPGEFKVGVGTTTPSITDSDLDHPIPIYGSEQVDDCETANWTDSADMTTSLNSTTYKQGSNSLNLTKDGTGSADANTYKTTTSRNFTDKDLSIWIYIKDATAYAKLATSNCLTIRFGSDSSNYWYWQKDKADLATGWNLVNGLTDDNADGSAGSPVVGSCDYTFVQLTADAAGTTWSNGDFMMDDIKVISSGDYSKIIVTGYPVLDETTLQAKTRCLLSVVDANGYDLTEFGLVNTDGTPLLFSRAVYTSISKTSSIQIIYVEKDKITTS